MKFGRIVPTTFTGDKQQLLHILSVCICNVSIRHVMRYDTFLSVACPALQYVCSLFQNKHYIRRT